MQLTAAAVDDKPIGAGSTFLKKLGFQTVGFSDFASADPEDCNYTWAKKKVKDGSNEFTLVAVVIQSLAFDNEVEKKGFMQNFTVNGENAEGDHYGFSRAVQKVIDDIAGLAEGSNTKFWIMGHSRGGAEPKTD